MKKLLSVFLAALMLFALCAPAVYAADYVAYPTVYINGGRTALYKPDGTKIAPVETPEGYLGNAVQDCITDLAKAAVTGKDEDIEAYKQKLVSWIAPLYEDLRLTDDGEAPAPIIVGYAKSGYFIIGDSVPNELRNGEYPIRAYNYFYDWRLDPLETADELARYIGLVMAATGRDKVNLVGRCEGGCPLLAYLAKYGHGNVHKIMFYNTASNGYLLPTQLCSGKVEIRMAQVRAWLNNNVHFSPDDLDMSAELTDLLLGIIDLSASSATPDLTGAALDAVYTRVLREVIPDVLLVSYGTMPAVWAMVAADEFDDAVQYVFAGREEQYAKLIEKIVYYHENVQLKSEELLRACVDDGIEIGALAKYGYPAIPLSADADQLSDGEALVKHLSFGATVSTHTGTLSDAYIASRDAKYISPDKKIDASTCLFPDTTWFFGRLDHQSTPEGLDELCQRFFTCRGSMDVDTYPAFPQYLLCDGEDGPIVPMTEENAYLSCVGTEAEEPGAASSFDRFMSGLLSLFLKLVLRVRGIIDGIVAHANGTAG